MSKAPKIYKFSKIYSPQKLSPESLKFYFVVHKNKTVILVENFLLLFSNSFFGIFNDNLGIIKLETISCGDFCSLDISHADFKSSELLW